MDDGRLVRPRDLGSTSAPDPERPHEVMWNTAGYASLRSGTSAERLVVDHRNSERLVGTWAGVVDEGVWVSGYMAPFGGPDLVRDHETIDDVMGLVAEGLRQADLAECRRIEVRSKPPHYSSSEPYVLFALTEAGFSVDSCDINYFLDLSSCSTVDDWRAGLKRESRRALRQASQLGLDVEELDRSDEDGWGDAYEVLRRNRVDRDRPMRLDLGYVRALRDHFAGLARMIVVRHEAKVIAAALVYRVAPGRDLVQYWGDHGHELVRSPMPVLVEAVVAAGLASGAATIDIGISTDHGQPNIGLMRFKRSMGCRAEPRLVMVKDLKESR